MVHQSGSLLVTDLSNDIVSSWTHPKLRFARGTIDCIDQPYHPPLAFIDAPSTNSIAMLSFMYIVGFNTPTPKLNQILPNTAVAHFSHTTPPSAND